MTDAELQAIRDNPRYQNPRLESEKVVKQLLEHIAILEAQVRAMDNVAGRLRERITRLVQAAREEEREACAKRAEQLEAMWLKGKNYDGILAYAANLCAGAIRGMTPKANDGDEGKGKES
jgi:hypothetical protein